MNVTDIHVHIFPQKIASNASDAINGFYAYSPSALAEAAPATTTEYEKTPEEFEARFLAEPFLAPELRGTDIGVLAESTGTSEAIDEAANRSATAATASVTTSHPITRSVIHSVATSPKQVQTINTFIANECQEHPEFVGFCTMHQDFENPAAELDRALSLGLIGVKLHPDFQKVNLDDPRLMHVYELAEERHMPLIIHTGDYRYDFSHPRRLKNVLHTFPSLVVDAAHLGGWGIFDEGVRELLDENCYVDVSSSMAFVGDNHFKEIVETFGPARVLFGSDYPMWNPAHELAHFLSLGFSENDYEKMCVSNAEAFLTNKLPC